MVPNGWRQVCPAAIVSFFSGFAFKSTDTIDNGIRWLKIANVGIGKIKWEDESFLPKDYEYEYSKFVLKVGDIVVAMTRPTLGNQLKIARLESGSDRSLLNQRVAKLIIAAGNNSEFIFQLFRTEHIAAQINMALLGTDPPNLSVSVLQDFKILVPPLIEQKKIAQILSTWDQAISATEQLLANSQQQKKALMQQLLTGKKRLLDENGVRFSGEWGRYTLANFGKCIRGVNYKPENICSDEQASTVRLLRSTNIQDGSLNDRDLVILPRELVKSAQILSPGDLAICMANGSKALVGKSAPFLEREVPYTVGAFCAIFRPLKSADAKFVKFIFESVEYFSQLLVILAGSSINNLKGSDIELIKIKAPISIQEQQKIASVLATADQEIEVLQKKLECLKQEKKALMQQLLTGKRRVKVAA
ncbi:restriction endonuclease subunit S [Acinetobacter baumannii]